MINTKSNHAPHVIVKLWRGKSAQQKSGLADEIVKNVMHTLDYEAGAISIAFEEINAADWKDKVYKPGILDRAEQL